MSGQAKQANKNSDDLGLKNKSVYYWAGGTNSKNKFTILGANPSIVKIRLYQSGVYTVMNRRLEVYSAQTTSTNNCFVSREQHPATLEGTILFCDVFFD